MFTKICPHCHSKSYSSSENGPWVCPQCNADITEVPVFVGIISDEHPIAERKVNEQDTD